MMPECPIKGVLFDMDDTLIDWSGFYGDWREIDREHLSRIWKFLEDAGRPLNGDFDTFCVAYREALGESWADARVTLRAPQMVTIMRDVLVSFGCIFDDTITLDACLTAYRWIGAPGVVVFPDVPAALQRLNDMGVRIGILTNAYQPMWMRDSELIRYDLLRYFPDARTRISAADLGYLKPHPNVFQVALEQMGTSPEETLFVGDNPVADIAGAQSAGMRAVLRINHPAPPLISGLIVPDAAVNSFEELLLLVEDWDKHADPKPY